MQAICVPVPSKMPDAEASQPRSRAVDGGNQHHSFCRKFRLHRSAHRVLIAGCVDTLHGCGSASL